MLIVSKDIHRAFIVCHLGKIETPYFLHKQNTFDVSFIKIICFSFTSNLLKILIKNKCKKPNVYYYK